MIHYVYIDVLFLINLMMNYLILWATLRMTQVRSSILRLMMASALGATYAVYEVVPGNERLYSFFGKLIVSVIMVFISFYPKTLLKTLQLLGYFMGFSCIVAGAALALIYLVPLSSGTLTDFSLGTKWWVVLVAGAIAMALGLVAGRVARGSLIKSVLACVRITVDGKSTTVSALVDSGNLLKDPVSGAPVIVVEANAMKNLLPPEWFGLLSGMDNGFAGLAELSGSPWANRIKVIPYSSLGSKNRLLLGFRPDSVTVHWGKNEYSSCHNPVIAICRGTLEANSLYRALLHPSLLKQALIN